MIIALAEYRQLLRYLRGPEFSEIAGIGDHKRASTPALYAALLLILVGIVAFWTVFRRIAL